MKLLKKFLLEKFLEKKGLPEYLLKNPERTHGGIPSGTPREIPVGTSREYPKGTPRGMLGEAAGETP